MVAPHASDDFGLPSAMLGPGAATAAKLRPEGGSIDRRPPVTASRPARRGRPRRVQRRRRTRQPRRRRALLCHAHTCPAARGV